jgi:outer membrane protein OmpA-like peptidoglycan-associated protein
MKCPISADVGRLKQIAEILLRHRDWKLRSAGHTDGIGGDKRNLDESKRRAAVKDALMKRYGIMANRLDTTGFGKSQPKDTNDKRAELMRYGVKSTSEIAHPNMWAFLYSPQSDS